MIIPRHALHKLKIFGGFLISPLVQLGEALINALVCKGEIGAHNVLYAYGMTCIFFASAALPELAPFIFSTHSEFLDSRLSRFLFFVHPMAFVFNSAIALKSHITLWKLHYQFSADYRFRSALAYTPEAVEILENLRRNKVPVQEWGYCEPMMDLQAAVLAASPGVFWGITELGEQDYTNLLTPSPMLAQLYILKRVQSWEKQLAEASASLDSFRAGPMPMNSLNPHNDADWVGAGGTVVTERLEFA